MNKEIYNISFIFQKKNFNLNQEYFIIIVVNKMNPNCKQLTRQLHEKN